MAIAIVMAVSLLSGAALAQGGRYDSIAQTTTSLVGVTVAVPLPGASITLCGFPASGFTSTTPCTNTATTYTDSTLAVSCPSNSPVVLSSSSSCQSSADNQGNFGFWVAPGAYDYSICVSGSCSTPNHAFVPLGNKRILKLSDCSSAAFASTAACATDGAAGGMLFPPGYAIGTFTNPSNVPVFNLTIPYWQGYCNVKDWGAKGDGSTADDAALLAAATFCLSRRLYVPKGTYKQTAAPLQLPCSLGAVFGDGGEQSMLTTAQDAENVSNSTAGCIEETVFRDIGFYNTFPVTLGAGATHFNVKLINPIHVVFDHVKTKSNFSDTDFSVNNHSGIWFACTTCGSSFMNWVVNSWIQNGQVQFDTSDSGISTTYVWGHPTQFAIKANAPNIHVVNNPGIIGSQSRGGVWVTASGGNTKVESNFFDGSVPSVNSGMAVYTESGLVGFKMVGNVAWEQSANCGYFIDPTQFDVSHNLCQNNNKSDNAAQQNGADFVIEGHSFNPQFNHFEDNDFFRSDAKTHSMPAIYEFNNGFDPTNNNFRNNSCNATAAQYLNPAIVRSGTSSSEIYSFPPSSTCGPSTTPTFPTLVITSTTPVANLSLSGGAGTQVISNRLASPINVVAFSATPNFNLALGNTQAITLTGNVTSSTYSNAFDGTLVTFVITEDATGGRTFVFPPGVRGAMTLVTTPNKVNVQSCIFKAADSSCLATSAGTSF